MGKEVFDFEIVSLILFQNLKGMGKIILIFMRSLTVPTVVCAAVVIRLVGAWFFFPVWEALFGGSFLAHNVALL